MTHFTQAEGIGLTALKEQVDDHSVSTRLHSGTVTLDLTSASPSIRLSEVEVPVTAGGILAIGTHFGVPSAFLNKIERDEAEWIIARRMERTPMEFTVRYDDSGVTGAYAPGQHIINPSRIVSVAEKVIGEDGVVTAFDIDPSDFHFDTTVPEGSVRGVGGDLAATVENYAGTGEPRVGDITLGGLRFGYDRKRNLAPWVEEFYWRLACTNGMEVPMPGRRIDARQADTVEDVLAELEAAAERAFSQAEARIAAHYDLRTVTVDNPERTLRRVGRDRGLPARTIDRLLDGAPTLPDEPTMFDVVNLITNEANNSTITRFSARRALQRTGGAEVAEHHERCSHCLQRIG